MFHRRLYPASVVMCKSAASSGEIRRLNSMKALIRLIHIAKVVTYYFALPLSPTGTEFPSVVVGPTPLSDVFD